jgi:hypothetical protein
MSRRPEALRPHLSVSLPLQSLATMHSGHNRRKTATVNSDEQDYFL